MGGYAFDWWAVVRSAGALAAGLLTAVEIAALSGVGATLLGLVGALAMRAPQLAIRFSAIGYVELMRNSPSLVKMYFIYFGLPEFGLFPTPFWSGVAALSLHNGAYLMDVFRAALASLPKAQTEAARSLGLGPIRTFRTVLWPQALPRALPGLGNVWGEMVKDTSLTSALSVRELVLQLHLAVGAQYAHLRVHDRCRADLSRPHQLRRGIGTGDGNPVQPRRRRHTGIPAPMTGDDAATIAALLKGLSITLELASVVLLLGLGGGMLYAAAARSGGRLRGVATVLLFLLRGIPLLMQVFAVFYVLPLFGLRLDPFTTAAIALALFASVTIGEILRGGIAAVAAGQTEAARALGLSSLQVFRLVVLPQATRIALGPLIGQLVFLIKATSVISLLGVPELMLAGREVIERNLEGMKVMALVWLLYTATCFPLSMLGRRLERTLPFHPV